jgi:hypothetical protein
MEQQRISGVDLRTGGVGRILPRGYRPERLLLPLKTVNTNAVIE